VPEIAQQSKVRSRAERIIGALHCAGPTTHEPDRMHSAFLIIRAARLLFELLPIVGGHGIPLLKSEIVAPLGMSRMISFRRGL